MNKIVLLNTSILTNFGEYKYEPISLQTAKIMIANGFESAIGHQSTCDILSELLEVSVNLNRIEYKQTADDIAIVFKLLGRPEEGKILTIEDIKNIGYRFGLIRKLPMTRKSVLNLRPSFHYIDDVQEEKYDWFEIIENKSFCKITNGRGLNSPYHIEIMVTREEINGENPKKEALKRFDDWWNEVGIRICY